MGALTKGSGWRNADEVLRIIANGSHDSRFANWIINGSGAINNPLQVPVDGPMAIIAEFVPITSLDIDGDGNTDVETDGMLILRYLFGFTGPALSDGIVDPHGAARSELEIVDYLELIRAAGVLDIDGNGNDEEDALTDGILILRYIAGYSSNSLSNNAVNGSDCRRCEDDVVEHVLDAFTP